MDVGKVPESFLEAHVLGRLGADREDVVLGPRHGVDFGVLSVGDRVVAAAADPLFIPLELGPERAAWYAFHVGVADVVLSGLAPTHLAVTLTLPPDADGAAFDPVWATVDREARALGATVLTGHTGRYEGADWPYVGGMTALAVGTPDRLVYPTGATPGDVLVATKGPAVETVGVLAVRFGDRLRTEHGLDAATVAAARERFEEISPVPDALAAAGTGRVTAMHDATERGVANALHELAAASGVRLTAEREPFPVGPGVEAVCAGLGVDPWTASSEGTVLMTVEPDGVEAVLEALADAGVRAAAVGRVQEGTGVTVDGEALPEPTTDPFWAAYTGLAADDGDDDRDPDLGGDGTRRT